jgi:hypothetical protein
MDRRLAVILAVCVLEAGFRSLSGHMVVDGLAYTLLARLVEMAVILLLAFRVCGVATPSVLRETGAGIVASAAFGVLVIGVDLASRPFIAGSVLNVLLARQPMDQWLLYLVTACVVGPFVEELFFRGLLYSWVRQGLPAWATIALTSVLFASMHGSISMVQLTGGLLFAALYEWRGNIWPCFVLHAAANLGLWIVPYIHPLM